MKKIFIELIRGLSVITLVSLTIFTLMLIHYLDGLKDPVFPPTDPYEIVAETESCGHWERVSEKTIQWNNTSGEKITSFYFSDKFWIRCHYFHDQKELQATYKFEDGSSNGYIKRNVNSLEEARKVAPDWIKRIETNEIE